MEIGGIWDLCCLEEMDVLKERTGEIPWMKGAGYVKKDEKKVGVQELRGSRFRILEEEEEEVGGGCKEVGGGWKSVKRKGGKQVSFKDDEESVLIQAIEENEKEGKLNLNFQVADVKKPLISVKRICQRGNTVSFGAEEGDNIL